jgi:hypothetical protein
VFSGNRTIILFLMVIGGVYNVTFSSCKKQEMMLDHY